VSSESSRLLDGHGFIYLFRLIVDEDTWWVHDHTVQALEFLVALQSSWVICKIYNLIHANVLGRNVI
jgi:hypothetical protein